MRIGVIGSGNIGSAAAQRFVDAGHDVAIANSRGPESLRDLVDELGERAKAATVEDAARFGELVLVAIPLGAIGELPAAAFAGKIVVDANNYYPGRDGQIPELDSDQTTSSELLARQLPAATVIKAFNTMYAATLRDQGHPESAREDRLVLYVAGDDPEAKGRVIELVEETGFAAVDTGSLAVGGRLQQPGSAVYTKEVTPAEAESLLGK
jgi:8-hydroxy-5-deazaflavin:NADPH oxidoreductase